MDQERFDALTRRVGRSTSTASRRIAVRRALAGGLGALVTGAFSGRSSSAHHCTDAGCGCATGTRHACGRGLVCCPVNPGLPGGGGVCAWKGECPSAPEPETCSYYGCECDFHDPYACDPGLGCCAEGWSFVCC